MNDYGHIDNATPSIAVSLYKDYRGLGIGTALMKEMLRILKDRGYKQASTFRTKSKLCCEYVIKKQDLKLWNEKGEEYSMLCRL